MKPKIEDYINCTCDVGFSSRDLVDPDCALCNHVEDIESYAKQHVNEFTLSQSPRTPIIMEAKEFYELKRMGLFTEDITSNPSPDYSLPFYQAIFVLMEDYAAQKCREREKEVVTEFQDFLLKNGYCDTDVYAEPPTAIDQFFSNK